MMEGSIPGRDNEWAFPFATSSRLAVAHAVSSLLSNWYPGHFPGGRVKRRGPEANHSLPFSAEVKNV
jgi:hypothetical protein